MVFREKTTIVTPSGLRFARVCCIPTKSRITRNKIKISVIFHSSNFSYVYCVSVALKNFVEVLNLNVTLNKLFMLFIIVHYSTLFYVKHEI